MCICSDIPVTCMPRETPEAGRADFLAGLYLYSSETQRYISNLKASYGLFMFFSLETRSAKDLEVQECWTFFSSGFLTHPYALALLVTGRETCWYSLLSGRES